MGFEKIKILKYKYLKFLSPSVTKEWNNRTKYIFNDLMRPISKDKVNLFWTGTYHGEITDHENLGDYLSLIIVNYVLKEYDLNLNTKTNQTHYLYAIGSIIGWGYQDAVIWGSGLLNEKNVLRCLRPKLDIRAVRGPCTKNVLQKNRIKCPEIYGDPAILLPLYYKPKVKKKWKYSLILHHNCKLRNSDDIKKLGIHYIEILTTDYKFFIEEILASEYIVSSALHGIILAESYSIPTIFLRENLNQDLKYDDWYFSTERYKYKYITDIGKISKDFANYIPNLAKMQKNLIKTFPYDLWKK